MTLGYSRSFSRATEPPRRYRARSSVRRLPRNGGRAGAARAGRVGAGSYRHLSAGDLILLGALPFWDSFRRRAGVQALMRGVNASVVGLLGAALYNPSGRARFTVQRDSGSPLSDSCCSLRGAHRRSWWPPSARLPACWPPYRQAEVFLSNSILLGVPSCRAMGRSFPGRMVRLDQRRRYPEWQATHDEVNSCRDAFTSRIASKLWATDAFWRASAKRLAP